MGHALHPRFAFPAGPRARVCCAGAIGAGGLQEEPARRRRYGSASAMLGDCGVFLHLAGNRVKEKFDVERPFA